MLGRVQQELFDLGGECSCPPNSLPEAMALLTDEACELLLLEMDEMLVELEPLESFILLQEPLLYPHVTFHVLL